MGSKPSCIFRRPSLARPGLVIHLWRSYSGEKQVRPGRRVLPPSFTPGKTGRGYRRRTGVFEHGSHK